MSASPLAFMNKGTTNPALPEGRLLNDRYRICHKLGGGGFGLTYLATVQESLVQGGIVVIKEHYPAWCVTRDTISGKVCVNKGEESRYKWSLDSFKHEAQQLSILNHPNIIRVTDAFEENNTAYYVMPYVRGGSMADGVKWMRRTRQRLSQAAVLKLMRTLLSALEHMHHSTLRGVPVYHLDIKPGNILLSANGAEELPILIDFGSPEMGSPGFIPHEQRTPKAIGPWTDIYALAASMHKVLTGKAPASHLDSKCNALTEAPRQTLLSQDRELLACYDLELLESIDQALSWEPSQRFSDAAQWLHILDSIPLRLPDYGIDLQRLMVNIRTTDPDIPKSHWKSHKKRVPEPSKQEWIRNIAIFMATAAVASFIGLLLLHKGEEKEPPAALDYQMNQKEQEQAKKDEEERIRIAQEEEHKKQLEQAKKDEEERIRIAQEEEHKKQLEQAKKDEEERIRIAQEEEHKKQLEQAKKDEEERIRIAQEEEQQKQLELAKKEEEERIRKAQEEERQKQLELAKKEEEERIRKAQEEERQKQLELAKKEKEERIRKAQEEERQKQLELAKKEKEERIRKAQEEERKKQLDKAKKEKEERIRKAQEEERKKREAQKGTQSVPKAAPMGHVCPDNPKSAKEGRRTYKQLQAGAAAGCPNCARWLRWHQNNR